MQPREEKPPPYCPECLKKGMQRKVKQKDYRTDEKGTHTVWMCENEECKWEWKPSYA